MVTAILVFVLISLLHTFCVAFTHALEQNKPVVGFLQLLWSGCYLWGFVWIIFLAIAVNKGEGIPSFLFVSHT